MLLDYTKKLSFLNPAYSAKYSMAREIKISTIFGKVNQLCFVVRFPFQALLFLDGALFICN